MKITARRISLHGLGKQRQRTVRQNGSARPKREVWARRSVYQLLLFIFRLRPGNESVTPPFFKNRPLAEVEFRAAQEHYVSARRRRRDPCALSKKPDRDLSKVFPLLDQLAASGDWATYKMIGVAAFALQPQQQRARELLANAATRGPKSRRSFLKTARKALPQAKNKFSPLEQLRLAAYRRGREFLWAFLVGEARALARERGGSAAVGAPAQADALAQHYPWIGLTSDQIRTGLARHDKQPDLDTAAEFKISPSYVRRLL